MSIIRSHSKPIFELEPEFDGSNPYMKFERNPIKKTKLDGYNSGRTLTDGWTSRKQYSSATICWRGPKKDSPAMASLSYPSIGILRQNLIPTFCAGG